MKVPPAWELIAPPNVNGLPASEFEGRHILRRAKYGESGNTGSTPNGTTYEHDPFEDNCHWRTQRRVWQNVVYPDDHILRASPTVENTHPSATFTDPVWTLAAFRGAWVACAGGLTDIGFATSRNFWCTGVSFYDQIGDLSVWQVDVVSSLDIPAVFAPFKCGHENVLSRTHDDPAHPMSGVARITIRPYYK